MSTTSKSPTAIRAGRRSVAPLVSAARTAMPSMAEASKGGEERRAQTLCAVTRPAASASGRRTASRRSGQEAFAQAEYQSSSASVDGGHGLVALPENRHDVTLGERLFGIGAPSSNPFKVTTSVPSSGSSADGLGQPSPRVAARTGA